PLAACRCRYSQADQWEALLGLHVQGQTSEWTVRRNVRRIVAHRDYNAFTYDNDIALMELDANVTLNQNIWPICLPAATHHFPPGQEAWITGWGATREGGEFTARRRPEGSFTGGETPRVC
ncbi:suppressor of tumorigenicity 14 protein-like, partial [Plectropomus leopardus]|uniref:suppressor of tumorigenicity 14 protein-like n=1 Tax=Plectropomus leopardus TaxID=160734 RepID=UPI001C4C297B